MKKVLLIFALCLLGGCNNDHPSFIESKYDDSFTKNLNSLFSLDVEKKYSNEYFNLKSYITSSLEEESYIYTFKISYKDLRINNIKFIVLPFNINKDNAPTSILSMGYNEQDYVLDQYIDELNYTFNGYKLSYLTYDNTVGSKFYFSGYINQEFVEEIFTVSLEEFNV